MRNTTKRTGHLSAAQTRLPQKKKAAFYRQQCTITCHSICCTTDMKRGTGAAFAVVIPFPDSLYTALHSGSQCPQAWVTGSYYLIELLRKEELTCYISSTRMKKEHSICPQIFLYYLLNNVDCFRCYLHNFLSITKLSNWKSLHEDPKAVKERKWKECLKAQLWFCMQFRKRKENIHVKIWIGKCNGRFDSVLYLVLSS